MRVVATAGHVDHGKSTLVLALTGTDPDRFPEEKARGLTIDQYFRANLLAREVTGEDVADAFVYLATAQATTGCVITVDGGNAAAFPR